MIGSFADAATEDLFNGVDSRRARSACPSRLWGVVRRKLTQLNRVRDLRELAVPPGNRLEVYYGDASRYDLLNAAGAGHAKLLVLSLDSPERTLALVHTARKHFPHLKIMARAFEWDDAHALIEAGVEHVYREALDTSVRLGTDALRMLGFRAHQAHRAAQKFVRHDQESLRELTAARRDGQATYLHTARRRLEDVERLLLADRAEPELDRDAGWDPESLRNEARARMAAAQASSTDS